MKLKLALLFTLLLTLITAVSADDSFADYYPENTGLFIEFNNTAPANSDFSQTAFSDMLKEPQTQKFVAHIEAKLKEAFTFAAIMTGGIKVEDMLSAFGNHVSFGLFAEGSRSFTLLIAEFPQAVNPLQLVAQMNPAGPNATEFNFTLPLSENQQKPFFLSIKIKGQKLFILMSSDAKDLDQITVPGNSNLSTSSEYLRASSKIGTDRLATIYFTPSLQQYSEAINGELSLGIEQAGLSMNDMTTTAVGMKIEAPAFVSRAYFKEPTLSFPYDFMTTPDIDHLSYVTTDSSATTTIGADFMKLLKFGINTFINSSPETMFMDQQSKDKIAEGVYNEVFAESKKLKAEYGVDPIEDIINNLDKEMTFYTQNTNNLPGLELFGFGGSTMIINVKNKDALASSLDSFIDTLIVRLEDQVATKLSIPTEYGTISGIALANAFTACYLIVDNVIIFSLNPAAIEYALDQREANNTFISDPALTQLQELMAAAADASKVAGEPVRVAIAEINGISDIFNNTVGFGASLGGIIFATTEAEKIRKANGGQLQFSPFPDPSVNPPAFVKYISEAFPMYLLPSKEVINKHVFDTWNVDFITPENELVEISYGPFPIDSMLFSKNFGYLVKAASYAIIGVSAGNLGDTAGDFLNNMNSDNSESEE